MNGNIFILKRITDIQNTVCESMYSRNRNVDHEGVNMYHWTVGLTKTKPLILELPFTQFLVTNFHASEQ